MSEKQKMEEKNNVDKMELIKVIDNLSTKISELSDKLSQTNNDITSDSRLVDMLFHSLKLGDEIKAMESYRQSQNRIIEECQIEKAKLQHEIVNLKKTIDIYRDAYPEFVPGISHPGYGQT